MPVSTDRTAGATITATDINGIATLLNTVEADVSAVASDLAGVVAGGGWTQTINNPLTSLTGFVTESGTWSTSGGVAAQSDVGGGTWRERYDTVFPGIVDCVVEVEVRLDSGAGNGGLAIGVPTGGGLYALRVDLRGDGTNVNLVGYEADAATAQGTVAISSTAYGVWRTLRVHVFGATSEVWVDGVYVGVKQQAAPPGPKIALVGYQSAASFRNLKAWIRPLP